MYHHNSSWKLFSRRQRWDSNIFPRDSNANVFYNIMVTAINFFLFQLRERYLPNLNLSEFINSWLLVMVLLEPNSYPSLNDIPGQVISVSDFHCIKHFFCFSLKQCFRILMMDKPEKEFMGRLHKTLHCFTRHSE